MLTIFILTFQKYQLDLISHQETLTFDYKSIFFYQKLFDETKKYIIIKSIPCLIFSEYKKKYYIYFNKMYHVVYKMCQLFLLKPLNVHYIL